VALALVLIALDALPRGAWWAGGPALVMCAVTAWPGVVDPSDLDARPVNAVPAIGVFIAIALTVAAVRRRGASFASRLPGDLVRVAAAAALLVFSLPWLAADLGWYLPGGVFLTDRIVTEGDETLAAVHLGHHHGIDGALMVLSAILLSRAEVWGKWLRQVTTACVALMLAYGVVNVAEDVWHEQLVKRGTFTWRIPSAVVPTLSMVWLVIVGFSLVAYAVLARERRVATEARPRAVQDQGQPGCGGGLFRM
ncbi:MAG: hypothetical protein FD127_4412, partial [Acidimicrobiaceae bacterium]